MNKGCGFIVFLISWLRKGCLCYSGTYGICNHASNHDGWPVFDFPTSSWI